MKKGIDFHDSKCSRSSRTSQILSTLNFKIKNMEKDLLREQKIPCVTSCSVCDAFTPSFTSSPLVPQKPWRIAVQQERMFLNMRSQNPAISTREDAVDHPGEISNKDSLHAFMHSLQLSLLDFMKNYLCCSPAFCLWAGPVHMIMLMHAILLFHPTF